MVLGSNFPKAPDFLKVAVKNMLRVVKLSQGASTELSQAWEDRQGSQSPFSKVRGQLSIDCLSNIYCSYLLVVTVVCFVAHCCS